MKKIIPILILTILFASAAIDKEIPSKLYYLDRENVDVWDYYASDGDMAIGLSNILDPYNFKGPSKIYEIYYDKEFTLLAVRNEYIKENKEEHYQRYDRNGVLRGEWFRKNSKDIGQSRTWHSNGVLKNITYYNNVGQTIADSTFYNNKKLSEAALYNNNEIYKKYNFYKSGKLIDELYYVQPNYKIALIVRYDTLTNKPTMFYANDTTLEDPNNPGTFMQSYTIFPVDSSILKKKK